MTVAKIAATFAKQRGQGAREIRGVCTERKSRKLKKVEGRKDKVENKNQGVLIAAGSRHDPFGQVRLEDSSDAHPLLLKSDRILCWLSPGLDSANQTDCPMSSDRFLNRGRRGERSRIHDPPRRAGSGYHGLVFAVVAGVSPAFF